MYSSDDLKKLKETYRESLLEDVMPFWMKHAIDREKGGFIFNLNRDGSVISTDKSIWIHGRFIWLLATMYDQVEAKEEWTELAYHGIDFLDKYGFDEDGRMFFIVTQDGKPLRKRRYVFSEFFAIVAFAAAGKAFQDQSLLQRARDLFDFTLKHLNTPGLLPPKVNPETRPSIGLVAPMITLVTAQVLRDSTNDPYYSEVIDRTLSEIEIFLNEDFQAVMEMVSPEGELIDSLEGRLLNPGHSIEAAWFVLHEAKYRNDLKIRELGLKILEWSWNWGWDEEYGGMIYYRDVKNLPPTEYWHDMKFWWPQCEAIIATLLAWKMTGDDKYAEWHQKIHDYTFKLFPDPEMGEWMGYLHRDGRLSTPVKGNLWKGPFHIPRMLLYCWQLLEEI